MQSHCQTPLKVFISFHACEVCSPVSPYSYTLSSNVEHQFQNLADSNGHSDSGLLDQIISGYLPMSVSATSPASSVFILKYFSNYNTLNCVVYVPQENYSTITPTCTGFNTTDHIMADLERFIETNYIGLYFNPEAQQQPQDRLQQPPRPQDQPQAAAATRGKQFQQHPLLSSLSIHWLFIQHATYFRCSWGNSTSDCRIVWFTAVWQWLL